MSYVRNTRWNQEEQMGFHDGEFVNLVDFDTEEETEDEGAKEK